MIGKQLAQPGQLEREPDLVRLALRGHAPRDARRANSPNGLCGARHRLELAPERRISLRLKALLPVLGKRATELPLGDANDVLKQQALVFPARLRERRRQALRTEHLRQDAIGDRLTIHQHTVAVEDHELRLGHNAVACVACRTKPRARPAVTMGVPSPIRRCRVISVGGRWRRRRMGVGCLSARRPGRRRTACAAFGISCSRCLR